MCTAKISYILIERRRSICADTVYVLKVFNIYRSKNINPKFLHKKKDLHARDTCRTDSLKNLLNVLSTFNTFSQFHNSEIFEQK